MGATAARSTDDAGVGVVLARGSPACRVRACVCAAPAQAGLFDVSHMLPLRFYGKDRAKFMEKARPR